MQGYLAALAMVLLVTIVVARVQMMRRRGTRAMQLGKLDKTDFLIPPFALYYLYTVAAAAFHLPNLSQYRLFESEAAAWIGVSCCALGLGVLVVSLVSFGSSFRVGIDTERPERLVTTGIFAFSRNPIYVGFASVLLGQFLVFPNWIPLIYLVCGIALFHRQVLREEAWLGKHYGLPYKDYCRKVRRYL